MASMPLIFNLKQQTQWPALAIWSLFQFGVAYPVLNLLSRYPEFFHTRQSSASELWWLVLILCVALPLLLVVTQRLVAAINGVAGRALFVALAFLLWLLVALSMAPEAASPALLAGLTIAVALLMTGVSLFTRVGAWFLLYLSSAIVIVPLLFLASSGIRPLLVTGEAGPITGPTKAGATPIVFVVFDELPTNALLDRAGGINRAWFPGFAALADTAHWYPNATTVAASTVLALPAMLTGRYPETFLLPHHGEYPNNLFTLLADTHAMNVDEAVTGMCPATVCGVRQHVPPRDSLKLLLQDVAAIYLNITLAPLLPDRFPPINQSWSGFWMNDVSQTSMYTDRLARLQEWSHNIGRNEQTTLDFTHLTFPHIPYEFLPSGQRYTSGWLLPGLDTPTQTWTGSEWQSRQAAQRFILQLQAIDRWLGELLTQMKSEGRFDESLIVVTADHGVSFEPGNGRRDAPSLANLEQNILPVPMFIKLPQQQRGEVSLRNAESIDILPTLAQALGREIPWAVDGVSLLAEPRPPGKRAAYNYREMTVHRTDTGTIAEALHGGWQRKTFLGLAGESSPWQLASQPELLGQSLAGLRIETLPEVEISIEDPERFESLDPDSDRILPVFLAGQANWPGADEFDVVIAVNGRVAAVVEPWGAGEHRSFAAMLPVDSLQRGANDLTAYVVNRPHDPASPLYASPGTGPVERWQWDPNQGVLSRNGTELEFVEEGLDGQIEMIDPGDAALEVLGWAMDTQNQQTVEKVLFFTGTELIGQAETLMLHHRTFEHDVVINLGFHAVIPRQHPQDDADSIVVIAVSQDGRALRLERAEAPQP